MDTNENITETANESNIQRNELERKINRDLTIEVSVAGHINFALQQNRIPIVKSSTIFNKSAEDLKNITLRIRSTPSFAETAYIRLDALPAIERITISDASVILNADYLVNINEKLTGSLAFELIDENQNLIQTVTAEINVLAYDEWLGTSLYPELYSSNFGNIDMSPPT